MTDAGVHLTARNVIDRYFGMWNETDPIRRRRIIDETWAPAASYIEPLMAAEGLAALDDGVAEMQAQFPGHTLRLTGSIDTHHDRVRWRWELLGPQQDEPLAGGTNIGVLASDGRLSQVTGFFDYTPDAD